MFYVYVLQSQKDDKFYIGYTSDLRKRFREHNESKSFATKYRKPFTLVYYEAYTSQKDAVDRERSLKRFSGAYTHLKKRIKNPVLSK